MRCRSEFTTAMVVLCLAIPCGIRAQGDELDGVVESAREMAPIDLTGYWVSIVSEDWRLRMKPAQKGDYDVIPLNGAGRRLADAWDPARDLVAGEECRAYGAAGIMRIPARFHITWEDDNTLRLDTDAGMQTRSFYFDEPEIRGGEPTWQGDSAAEWQFSGQTNTPFNHLRFNEGSSFSGQLKVETTNMRPGYYFKHGIPYSASAVMTEYFVTVEDGGLSYLFVTTIVDDPEYLEESFVRTLHFRRERDDSKWNETPCVAAL